MTRQPVRMAVVAAAWALGTSSAWATNVAQASISMTGLTFDVSAVNGSTAKPFFQLYAPSTDTLEVTQTNTADPVVAWTPIRVDTTRDSSTTLSLPNGQATVTRNGMDLSASTQLIAENLGKHEVDGARAGAPYFMDYYFTLGYNTSVTVTAQFTFRLPSETDTSDLAKLPTAVRNLAKLPNGGIGLTSELNAEMLLRLYEPNGTQIMPGVQISSLFVGHGTTDNPDVPPSSNWAFGIGPNGENFRPAFTVLSDGGYGLTVPMSVTISNTYLDGVDAKGYFGAYLQAASRFNTRVLSPVPEPATYALMGLGLVGLSVVARQRRARQAH